MDQKGRIPFLNFFARRSATPKAARNLARLREEHETGRRAIAARSAEQMLAEHKAEELQHLERILNSDRLIQHTRQQLATNPAKLLQFEARLLFNLAIAQGAITEPRNAARQFMEFLNKLDVERYSQMVQADPQMIHNLCRQPGLAMNNLNIDRRHMDEISQVIERLGQIARGENPRD